jgi:hypothetical protein
MTNFAEFNSPQDRVYTTVNRQLLSTWLQTWTNQPAEASVRSLHVSTGQAPDTLKLNPKRLKGTRQRRKAIS